MDSIRTSVSLPSTAVAGLASRAGVIAVALALVWSYWATLGDLAGDWQRDDNYSVGQLVPFAALYLLWTNRRQFQTCRLEPSLWGLALLIFAQAVRGYGLLFLYDSAERYSFVLTIAGLVLLMAGREVFRRAFWILAFLLLMVPLPGRIHNLISAPLQDLATGGAVAALQLLGVSVAREGHILVLNDSTRVAVAEACSGLRMLTAFVVVAATLAFLVQRPPWKKAGLLAASIPIAIACNLLRLTATALVYLYVGGDWVERWFHDVAGWLMMPVAVLLLAAVLWVLDQLVTSDAASETLGSRKAEK